MAVGVRYALDAEDQSKGVSINELVEFAHTLELAIKRGDIQHDDLILGRVGVASQVKKLVILPKSKSKGKWNVA